MSPRACRFISRLIVILMLVIALGGGGLMLLVMIQEKERPARHKALVMAISEEQARGAARRGADGKSAPDSPRQPVTDEELEEMFQKLVKHFKVADDVFFVPGAEARAARAAMDACMDTLVARLGVSGRMRELLERANSTGALEGLAGCLQEAVDRGLRKPGAHALRAELVKALPDAMQGDAFYRKCLLSWFATAGETAEPGEFDSLLAAVQGREEARDALARGQSRAGMREDPLKTLNAAREVWLVDAGMDAADFAAAQAADAEPGETFLTEEQKPSAGKNAWEELEQLAKRVPPGADYAALDAVLLSLPRQESGEGEERQEGTGGIHVNTVRASVLTSWVRDQPEAAATWLATRPAGEAENLGHGVMENLIYRQPETVSGWVQAMPPGPVRDRIAHEAAVRFSREDPATAARLAALIIDPGRRANAAEHLYVPPEK